MSSHSGAEKMNMRSVCFPRAGQVAAGALLVLLAAVAPARAQYGRPSMRRPRHRREVPRRGGAQLLQSRSGGHRIQRVARHHRERNQRQIGPRLRRQARFASSASSCGPARSTSSASPIRRSIRGRLDSGADDHLQRHLLTPLACPSRPSSSGTRGASATNTTSSTPTAATPASSSKRGRPTRASS